jgi:hypothetical protein
MFGVLFFFVSGHGYGQNACQGYKNQVKFY